MLTPTRREVEEALELHASGLTLTPTQRSSMAADALEERAKAYILEQKVGLGNPLQKSNLVEFARSERRRVWEEAADWVEKHGFWLNSWGKGEIGRIASTLRDRAKEEGDAR